MDRFSVGADGWCAQACRYDSPNFDARPPGAAIELLVIHNISLPAGQFGGPHIADLFTNRVDFHAHPSFSDLRGLEVSAHFLVRRDGRVLQFVSCEQRAWHAGRSRFEGREQCNDFSIGIEMEGSDHVAFSPAQYESLAGLTRALCARYHLTAVQGHEHIAPGRKTDPGPFFEWERYRSMLSDAGRNAFQNEAMLVGANRVLRFPPALPKVKAQAPKK
jgi:AmpD protein